MPFHSIVPARARPVPFRFCFFLIPLLLLSGGDLAFTADSAVPVEVVRVEKGNGMVEELSLTGSVSSLRQSRLSSRTSGLVMEMKVDAGSSVAQGDVLMRLDQRLGEISLDGIRAEITRAELELAEAARQAEEVRALAESGGFARSEAESRRSAVRIREATLEQLRAAESEQMEIVERHRLVAPFAGVITRKTAEAGEWVQTGTPVLELVETGNLRFDIQVPQENLSAVKLAREVAVKLDAYPGEEFPAEIEVSVPVQDAISRTSLARLVLEDPEERVAPGMSGTAIISYQERGEGTVKVHRDAVVRYPGGLSKVWVIVETAGGKEARSREVKTSGSLGQEIEILEGLAGDEVLVLKGNESLSEGQAVEAIQTAEAITKTTSPE